MTTATSALPVRAERLWAALLAATLMNLPLGSVYAFSVLLRPIEQELAIPRSALSLVFGLATAGFTIGSVGAPFFFRLAPAPVLLIGNGLTAYDVLLQLPSMHSKHRRRLDRLEAEARRLREDVPAEGADEAATESLRRIRCQDKYVISALGTSQPDAGVVGACR